MLAGPNGAGKTTASRNLLHDALGITQFVNADGIATGLSAFAPELVGFEAGRIMIRRMNELLHEGASFAFETTLSSKSLLNFVNRARANDFAVDLIYLALPSPQIAKQRVAARVKGGGHDVPVNVIERRFYRSLVNLFELYLPVVSRWEIYDNYAATPALIAYGSKGSSGKRNIVSEQKWQELVELSQRA